MNAKKLSILVVDDDASLRDTFAVLLEEDGIEVLQAENGKVAWELLGRQRVDVVISDVIMPEMDGVQLLKLVHGLPEGERPLIYMMSGYSDLGPEQAQELGAAGILGKPFDIELLIKNIKEQLGGRA